MKTSRQMSSNKGTRGANASSPEDPTGCSEGDKLTASVLTTALDSLRVDICTKIELDLENRFRRNNIRLVGIPEDQEGVSATEFVSGVLQEVLKLDEKPLLDQAHRTLQAKPKPNQPPRPFVIRVHYFQVRELILRHARQL